MARRRRPAVPCLLTRRPSPRTAGFVLWYLAPPVTSIADYTGTPGGWAVGLPGCCSGRSDCGVLPECWHLRGSSLCPSPCAAGAVMCLYGAALAVAAALQVGHVSSAPACRWLRLASRLFAPTERLLPCTPSTESPCAALPHAPCAPQFSFMGSPQVPRKLHTRGIYGLLRHPQVRQRGSAAWFSSPAHCYRPLISENCVQPERRRRWETCFF